MEVTSVLSSGGRRNRPFHGGRIRRRISVVFIAAMLGAASIASGQSEGTTGLLVPVDFNGVPDAAGVNRPGFRM